MKRFNLLLLNLLLITQAGFASNPPSDEHTGNQLQQEVLRRKVISKTNFENLNNTNRLERLSNGQLFRHSKLPTEEERRGNQEALLDRYLQQRLKDSKFPEEDLRLFKDAYAFGEANGDTNLGLELGLELLDSKVPDEDLRVFKDSFKYILNISDQKLAKKLSWDILSLENPDQELERLKLLVDFGQKEHSIEFAIKLAQDVIFYSRAQEFDNQMNCIKSELKRKSKSEYLKLIGNITYQCK